MTARLRSFSFFAVAVTLALLASAAGALHAQQPPAAALSGTVRSAAEGPMEGVLVTIREAGATYATTVVTDAKGAYRFPAARVGPGTYTVGIRASGYVLGSPMPVAITTGKTTRDDLQLRPANDLED